MELSRGASRARGPAAASRPTSRCSRSTGRICSSTCRIPQVPGQFYIANVGKARSSGVEFELNGRAREGVDLFAHRRLHAGAVRRGDHVERSSTSRQGHSEHAGLHRDVRHAAVAGDQFGAHSCSTAARRSVFYGAFKYDDTNFAGQDAYSLANFRAGVARQARVRGSVDPERVRHDTTSRSRSQYDPARAVRVYRRERPSADLRYYGRCHFLNYLEQAGPGDARDNQKAFLLTSLIPCE